MDHDFSSARHRMRTVVLDLDYDVSDDYEGVVSEVAGIKACEDLRNNIDAAYSDEEKDEDGDCDPDSFFLNEDLHLNDEGESDSAYAFPEPKCASSSGNTSGSRENVRASCLSRPVYATIIPASVVTCVVAGSLTAPKAYDLVICRGNFLELLTFGREGFAMRHSEKLFAHISHLELYRPPHARVDFLLAVTRCLQVSVVAWSNNESQFVTLRHISLTESALPTIYSQKNTKGISEPSPLVYMKNPDEEVLAFVSSTGFIVLILRSARIVVLPPVNVPSHYAVKLKSPETISGQDKNGYEKIGNDSPYSSRPHHLSAQSTSEKAATRHWPKILEPNYGFGTQNVVSPETEIISHLTHPDLRPKQEPCCWHPVYQHTLSDHCVLAVVPLRETHRRHIASFAVLVDQPGGSRWLWSYSLVDMHIRLEKGPISAVQLNPKTDMVIPLTDSFDGVIAISPREIKLFYFNNAEQFCVSRRLETEIKFTSWCTLRTDPLMYLLCDHKGMIRVLHVARKEGLAPVLRLGHIGSSVSSFTMVCFAPSLVFAGSRLGDSTVFRVHDNPTKTNDIISNVMSVSALGPIVDMAVTMPGTNCEADGTNDSKLLTCSGSFDSSTLRFLRHGVRLSFQNVLLSQGCERVFCDSSDTNGLTFILFSNFAKTFVFWADQSCTGRKNANEFTLLTSDCEPAYTAFKSDQETLLFVNLPATPHCRFDDSTRNRNGNNFGVMETKPDIPSTFLHVTTTSISILLARIRSTLVTTNETLQVGEAAKLCPSGRISHAFHAETSSIGHTIAFAVESTLKVCNYRGRSIGVNEYASHTFQSDVSCLAIFTECSTIAVGLWNSTVHLLKYPNIFDTPLRVVEVGPAVPSSICLPSWKAKGFRSTLLCGLTDGTLVIAKNADTNDQKKLIIGNAAVRLHVMKKSGNRAKKTKRSVENIIVIASSDESVIISPNQFTNDIITTKIAVQNINDICLFRNVRQGDQDIHNDHSNMEGDNADEDTGSEESADGDSPSVLVATTSCVGQCVLDTRLKVHQTTYDLFGESAQRIAVMQSAELVAVATEMFECVTLAAPVYTALRIFEQQTMALVQSIPLQQDESVSSLCTASYPAGAAEIEVLLAGTVIPSLNQRNQEHGRILLFVQNPGKRDIGIAAEITTKGPVHSVTGLLGRYVVAAVGTTVSVYLIPPSVLNVASNVSTKHSRSDAKLGENYFLQIETKLLEVASFRGFVLPLRVETRGNQIFAADVMLSFTILEFDQTNGGLHLVAKDQNPQWIMAIKPVAPNAAIVADSYGNVQIVRPPVSAAPAPSLVPTVTASSSSEQIAAPAITTVSAAASVATRTTENSSAGVGAVGLAAQNSVPARSDAVTPASEIENLEILVEDKSEEIVAWLNVNDAKVPITVYEVESDKALDAHDHDVDSGGCLPLSYFQNALFRTHTFSAGDEMGLLRSVRAVTQAARAPGPLQKGLTAEGANEVFRMRGVARLHADEMFNRIIDCDHKDSRAMVIGAEAKPQMSPRLLMGAVSGTVASVLQVHTERAFRELAHLQTALRELPTRDNELKEHASRERAHLVQNDLSGKTESTDAPYIPVFGGFKPRKYREFRNALRIERASGFLDGDLLLLYLGLHARLRSAISETVSQRIGYPVTETRLAQLINSMQQACARAI